MRAEFSPSIPQGRVAAPPSKSAAHRILICAGLADGVSTVRNVGACDDVLATLDCLRAIGAGVHSEEDGLRITGTGGRIRQSAPLDCRESGSTLRFFLPLCLLGGGGRMRIGRQLAARPLGEYEKICRERGIVFEKDEDGLTLGGGLSAGEYVLSGEISSQFASGLLFALPLLEGDSRIRLTGGLVSRPYVEMTRDTLARFGVSTAWEDERTIFVPGGQRYRAKDQTVEGDASAAAVFAAMQYFGGDLTVTGLSPDSRQADRVYPALLEQVAGGAEALSLDDCPDLSPVLFAVAAETGGARFLGTGRLRFKESDRAQAMAKELRRFGAEIAVGENEVAVEKRTLHAPDSVLDGHGDHRVVMALSLLCIRYGGVIDGAEAVAKSVPDFFEMLKKLGVKVEICK